MPSSTRRARERAGTRDRIVGAALHVLETEGPAALTIRRIAADVEYTAPIVYQHFAGKDALVLELVARGYAMMMDDFRRVLDEPDIDRRMTRLAAEYVRFAGDHPHLYEAMNGTLIDAEARRAAGEPAKEALLDLIRAWSEAHDVTLPDLAEACEILWGTMYGLASLGRLETIGTPRAQRLAENALTAILRGWLTAP